MYKTYLKNLGLILGLLVLIVGFQNCSEAVFSNTSTASGKNTGMDVGAPEEPPVDPDIPADPMDDEVVLNVQYGCTDNDISDIRLNINSVTLGGTNLTAALGVRSLVEMAEGFNVILDKSAKGGQVRLKLEDFNNQVVDSAGQAYALKTPSAQQSGLKIVTKGNLQLKGNTAYTLRFFLDPATQVVRTGSGKCILKPVLHLTAVEEFEF